MSDKSKIKLGRRGEPWLARKTYTLPLNFSLCPLCLCGEFRCMTYLHLLLCRRAVSTRPLWQKNLRREGGVPPPSHVYILYRYAYPKGGINRASSGHLEST